MQYFYQFIKGTQKMDLFQTLKSQAQTQSIRQKSRKIYLFNKRKSTNLYQNKLNQHLHPHHHTPEKHNQSYPDTSIKKYLSQEPKASRMVTLTYKEQQHEAQIRNKKRLITNKIISNFHISSFKTRNLYIGSINKKGSKSQLYGSNESISEPNEYSLNVNQLTVNNRNQNQRPFPDNQKNNSLPYLNKRSISFADISSTLLKPRKFHSHLENYGSLHEDDVYFLKNGAISGQNIYNSRTNLAQASIQQKHDEKLININSKTEPDLLDFQYYSLTRKMDDQKMTNHARKKIIRNSLISIKQKTNSFNKSFKITQVRGKSLIKLQQILAENNKKTIII